MTASFREYERSHPWIKFVLDLRQFTPDMWLLLGEARSKLRHLAVVPIRPTTAARLHELYLAKGIHATTAIEGNTLSEDEVQRVIGGQLKLPPSKAYLEQEVQNILAGCEMIWKRVNDKQQPLAIDITSIRAFNRTVLHALEVGDEVVPGQVRRHSVGVGAYRGAPWEDCEYLLDRLGEWLVYLERQEAGAIDATVLAILRAILAHLYLAWIHPFGDGNGRTARLVEFALLLQAGAPTPAAHLLSNHYNETRTEYYRQLDMASKSGGDVVPFIRYALVGLVDGLRKQVDDVCTDQMSIAWTNYVYTSFGQSPSAKDVRQRTLVLALSAKGPKKPSELLMLSERVFKSYEGKTSKTVTRDVRELLKRGLILVEGGMLRARTEIMRGFLAQTRDGSPLSTAPAAK